MMEIWKWNGLLNEDLEKFQTMDEFLVSYNINASDKFSIHQFLDGWQNFGKKIWMCICRKSTKIEGVDNLIKVVEVCQTYPCQIFI